MASVVVGQLDGSNPGRRIQVVLEHSTTHGSTIELREQHHAQGLGWFDQRCLRLDPSQVSQLLGLLGERCTMSLGDSRDSRAEVLQFAASASGAVPIATERRVDAI